jgi:hypothetical protein
MGQPISPAKRAREHFAVCIYNPPLRLPHSPHVIYTYGLPLSHLIQAGARDFNAETYISTQQAQALKKARVPDSHENEKWSCRAVTPPGQGAQACFRRTGFPRLVFPQRTAKAVIIINYCAGM